jgi:regulator of PEP synthase PpsR (kinase-PPPase family)
VRAHLQRVLRQVVNDAIKLPAIGGQYKVLREIGLQNGGAVEVFAEALADLAMQFGISAANYPLIPEDFSSMLLPSPLRQLRGKLYGLTIRPERLQQIRTERRPGSQYATLANCEFEVREAEALMRQEGIPYLDATSKSVEELATTILHEAKLVRRIY